MKSISILAALLALSYPIHAAADCMPKEAAGTGSKMLMEFSEQGTVVGWHCGKDFEWVGTKQKDFIPFGVEDLLIRQLLQLKAFNDNNPKVREDLRRTANALEIRSKP